MYRIFKCHAIRKMNPKVTGAAECRTVQTQDRFTTDCIYFLLLICTG